MSRRNTLFLVQVLAFVIMIEVLLCLFAYPNLEKNADGIQNTYNMDIAMLVFFGFGLMVSFLERYTVSSLGILLMTVAQSLVLYIFINQLWTRLLVSPGAPGGMKRLSMADIGKWYYCALASFISISSCLGRIGFVEAFHHNIINIIAYSITETIVLKKIMAVDTGRTMSLFVLAGTIGLVNSCYFKHEESKDHILKNPTIRGYVFALLGVGTAWVFFATFNSAYAVGYQKSLAYDNTWYALATSTITTYCLSFMVRGKIDPYDVIFNSLSGAIAVGCSADFIKNPAAALALGVLVASLLFLLGYWNPLNKYSEDAFGLVNLSLISGLFGGLYSGIIIAFYTIDGGFATFMDNTMFGDRNFVQQGSWQVLGTVAAFLIGLVAGLVNLLLGIFTKASYEDSIVHEVIDLETNVKSERMYFYSDDTEFQIPEN